MTPGSKHNDEHDEAQKKVFRGYGFRPGGKNHLYRVLEGGVFKGGGRVTGEP